MRVFNSDDEFRQYINDPGEGTELGGLPRAFRVRVANLIIDTIGSHRFARTMNRLNAIAADQDPLALDFSAQVAGCFAELTRHTADDVLAAYALRQANPDGDLPFDAMVGCGVQLGRWAENGYPVVCISAQQAASLMLTDVADGQVPMVRAPWRSFIIELPPGALPCIVDGSAVDATRIGLLVQQSTSSTEFGEGWTRENKWTIRLDVGARSLWEFNRSVGEIASGTLEDSSLNFGQRGEEPDRLERRATLLASKLVVALCLAISDPSKRILVASQPKRKWSLKPYRLYALALPVKIDARRWVRDYSTGAREVARSVRWVVRGHFRNQACGPRMTDHRLRWIEPYWKGPEGAVELNRPHVLAEPNQVDGEAVEA